MKKKNRSPLYCKPKIIDGIDVKNIHCYSYREMLEAEIKNHNAEIQYAIYDCLRSSRGDEKFKLDALKEFSKNKKFHEAKIQERYQVMEREDNDVNFSYVKKRYIDGIAQDISIGKAEQWLEKAAAQNNPDALFVIANRELEKFKEGKIIDANYVTDNFERALAFGSLKAAEFLIPVYLTGKDGLPKREVRAKIIIKCFNTPKYKFYLSKDNSYCNIEEEWWKYDNDGNNIYHKDFLGRESWWEYDANGREIHLKKSSGYEKWWDYDDERKIIHTKDSCGVEEWYKYDANGKISHSVKRTKGNSTL